MKFENQNAFNIKKRKLYTIRVQKNHSEKGKNNLNICENFGVRINAEKQR